jgi:hypothetical protein
MPWHLYVGIKESQIGGAMPQHQEVGRQERSSVRPLSFLCDGRSLS